MTGDAESSRAEAEILTLEPLVDAIRDGVEGAGWRLSGLQKTTSQEFEGRWAGETSRSAYLFFHHPDSHEDSSIDVYLDEGRKGVSGNLALAVDGRDLGDLHPFPEQLAELAAAAEAHLLRGYSIPLTLRVRMDPRGGEGPDAAEPEVRFKIRIPKAALRAGPGAVAALSASAVVTFEQLLGSSPVEAFRLPPSD